MIKVSIILPVYNVEEYLIECLDSIINQTLKDIEIIAIDDMSTDKSYPLLQEYFKKYSFIKLYRNDKNYGVGYTRNFGLKKSLGEYIYFMDPDDYISLNFLEDMYNTAKKYDSDIVNTNNIYNIKLDKEIIRYWGSNDNIEMQKDYQVTNRFDNFMTDDYNLLQYYTLWTRLFKRSFLLNNNIFSPENKIGAAYDADVVFKSLLYDPKTSFNNKPIYYYRIRENSIMHKSKNNSEVLENIINNHYKIIELYKSFNSNSLNLLYINLFATLIHVYNKSDFKQLYDLYNYMHNFANFIFIDEKLINRKSFAINHVYEEYLLFRINNNYSLYCFNRDTMHKIHDLENKINYLQDKIDNGIDDNWFRLFGIKNSKKYFVIVIFGAKIVIKK